jgi:alkanesulfonate monooxygenase SsuD/methylene tetrahydromethanopterin reductase-like flavin-dependent oxidoreductase (luciferase family)
MQALADLRESSPKYGHTFTRDKAVIGVMVYVAESKEKAEQEWMEHLHFFFKDALRTTPRYLVPPGYVTPAEFRKRISGPNLHGDLSWDALTQQFFVVCGTPDMVAESIATWAEEAQSSRINCFLHLGTMPHWMTVKNMTLFAEEVIPRLRSKTPELRDALPQAAE